MAVALVLAPPAWAGRTYVPGANEFGTLLYEDQWPAAGDFDFNDVVIRYNVEIVDDGLGAATEVVYTLNVAALGASGVCSGLAVRIPAPPSAVGIPLLSVGTAGTGAPWDASTPLTATDANGAAPGGDTVVWIADDLRAVAFPASTGFVNTEAPPALPGRPLAVTIPLVTPTVLAPSEPFDVFLFHCGDPGVQIHRPGYQGTVEVDTGLYGTADDDSDGAGGSRWYVTGAGVPFALHIGEGVDASWPTERTAVDDAWPSILAFAASNGATSSDFYDDGEVVTANLYGAAPPNLTVQPQADIVDVGGGVRGWAGGTYATSCDGYRNPGVGHGYTGFTGSGVYRVQPPAHAAFDAWCDMDTDGGGWTRCAVFRNGNAYDGFTYTYTEANPGVLGYSATGNFCMKLPFDQLYGESWSNVSTRDFQTPPIPVPSTAFTVPLTAAWSAGGGTIGFKHTTGYSAGQLTGTACTLQTNGHGQGSGVCVASGSQWRNVSGLLNSGGYSQQTMCDLNTWCGSGNATAWIQLYAR